MSTTGNYDQLYMSEDNILLHGPGGTGKSYDIQQLIDYIKGADDHVNFAYLAPTGTAACNIGGLTIHSFFGLKIFANFESSEEELNTVINTARYEPNGLQLLIIDEISMVGEKLLRIMDAILRRSYNVNKPMGGVRCIFSGDFYQLPPVKDDYCFCNPIWQDLNFTVIHYTEQKRYTCGDSFNLLMRLRENKLTKDDKNWLLKRLAAYKTKQHLALDVKPVIIYTRNIDVETLNNSEMAKLTTKKYTYVAKNTFKALSKRIMLDPREQDKLLSDVVDKTCTLKVGANVMFYRNYDITAKLTNGRLATVLEIDEEKAVVRVRLSDGLIHDVRPKEFELNGPGWRLSRTQIPLRPAWAITNYKCQGMTLDYAIVELSKCFAYGQAYTTLARVVSIDNLFLINIDFNKIKSIDSLPFE